jgi:hypothetical protein
MSKQDQLEVAREQADEYASFAQSAKIKAPKTGEEFTVPNLLLLDDEQQAAFEKLQHMVNKCDRYPDTVVPEREVESTDEDGTVTKTKIAAHTMPGDFIQPYQKDGELLDPPYTVQLAKILLGEEQYEKFKAGGGSSQQLNLLLRKMRQDTEERAKADPK